MSEERKVKLIVLSAMLSALHDIMGKDGKNSILRFAGLPEYIDKDVPPSLDESVSFIILKKLIDAMHSLLGHGTNAILYESGRKFAVYLSPFGYSLEEVIKKLEDWLGGHWTLIKGKTEDSMLVKIRDNPICKDLHSESPYCHIISGALARIQEESTGMKTIAKEIRCKAMGHENCEFLIKSTTQAKND
ncbi:MAG: V4R domain-containing protein [Candidatus Helarchaeales archaeon]